MATLGIGLRVLESSVPSWAIALTPSSLGDAILGNVSGYCGSGGVARLGRNGMVGPIVRWSIRRYAQDILFAYSLNVVWYVSLCIEVCLKVVLA